MRALYVTLLLILLIVSGCNKDNIDEQEAGKKAVKEDLPFNVSINNSQSVNLSTSTYANDAANEKTVLF